MHGLSPAELLYADSPKKFFLGIDPGLHGAIAVLNENGEFVEVIDMPIMAAGNGTVKNQVNPRALFDELEPYVNAFAVLEIVRARPGQGVASMFSLGDSYGCARAILSAMSISTYYLLPSYWKKHYRLTESKFGGFKGDKGHGKELARAKAIELFPKAPLSRKQDADRAEALLMANYAFHIRQSEA